MRGNIGNFLIAISSAGFFSLSCVCVCVCGVLLLLLLLSLDEKRRRKKGLLLLLFWPWGGGGGKGPWMDLTLDAEKQREKERENLQIPAETKMDWTLNLTNFGRLCFPTLSFFPGTDQFRPNLALSCKAKLQSR